MKDFKHTGKKSISGHGFPSGFGFSGSTGKVKSIKPYTRREPMKKATGGAVGNSATLREDPVTEFDKDHGGRGPLRSGYSKGGALHKALGGPVKAAQGGPTKNYGSFQKKPLIGR